MIEVFLSHVKSWWNGNINTSNLHYYSWIGYIFSPHSAIFKHSKNRITYKDKLAVERLITVLFIPKMMLAMPRLKWKPTSFITSGYSNMESIMYCLFWFKVLSHTISSPFLLRKFLRTLGNIYRQDHNWWKPKPLTHQHIKCYSNPKDTLRKTCRYDKRNYPRNCKLRAKLEKRTSSLV